MASPRQGAERTWRIKLDDTTVLEVATPRPRARRSRRSKLILGAFVAALTLSVAFAAGAAAEGTPSIGSDKPDYAPGEAVALTGSGWAAGETVHIAVDDDQSDAWSYESDVTAADDTTVSDALTLPEVAGTYTVTATAPSATASATFTATAPAPPPPPPPPPPPASEPSITSDKADYAPGEAVALSGSGWAAGEAVHVAVDDDQSDAWTHEADLTAADDGTVSDSFDLTELEGAFAVSATAPSGSADMSFTVTAQPPAPTTDPTLSSDKDAYSPGATVTLSGTDWTAGNTVHVAVNDDGSDAWDHSADVTVAADGTITDTFDLPDGLAAEFTATATDPTDRSATATFSAGFGSATEPYLVRFAAGTSTDTQAQILAAAGAVSTNHIAPLRIHGVLLPGGASLQTSIDKLRSYPSVTRVEPDRTREAGGTPNDSNYGDQWSLTKIGWENVFGTVSPSGSAKVAILDTGIDGSHPDLDGNVVSGTSILDGSSGLSDPNGHGTAMAGIVAAETDNGAGVAGVGFAGVTVMPVTVLGPDGTGQDSDIIEGVVYAADNGADVILMAFSNPGYSEMLQAAVDYAWDEGVVLVAATGNDGSSTVTFPAGDRSVIGVSNTDQNDALAGSSNYGQAVFLGAPGTGIATTDAGGGTTSISGTSASAAHVAGAAALIKAASGASNGVIVSRLAKNAEPAGTQEQTGNGRLNLDRAVADTSTEWVQPAGAAPVGGGGPFVGPYTAALTRNLNLTFAGAGGGSVTITVLPTQTVNAPVSCGGTGTDQISQTVTSTCAPNITLNTQGNTSPTATFLATPNGSSTFGGWSGQASLSPNTCTGTTNPCAATLGPNPALTVTFNAANTAPTVVFVSPPTTANEGETKTYNFNISDPNAGDTFTFVGGFPTCGTGGSLVSGSASINNTARTGTFQCSFPDGPASPTVQVRVQDSSGAQSNTASQAVSVANVAPTVELTGDASANEGQTKTYTYTVTDPGDDPNPTITESCGDNGTRTDTPAANSFDCTFPDGPASSTVEVTADDGDPSNSTGSDSIVVAVANVAPTVELTGDASANEGQTKTYTYTVTDPGDDPNPTITESCGDNGTRTDTPAANSFDCTFPDGPASSTVEVTADDGDPSNSTGSDSIVVAVANVAPTVELTGDASANEGQTKTYTYTVTDPGDDPNPTITESCGDNGTRTDTPAANSFDCTFPDGPASSTVEVTADDGDPSNSTGSDSIVVAVANVAPTVELTGDASANEGQTKTYTYTVTDPGDDPNPTITESCGDNGTRTDTPAANSFDCTFPDGPASSTVEVTADDGDPSNSTGSDSIVVAVANVAPTVELTGDASANEGQTKTYTYTVTDPGDDPNPTITESCGDNGTRTDTPAANSFDCTFPDGPASSTVEVTADDGDPSNSTGSDSIVVAVANVAPTVELTGDASANEGQTKTYTYTVTDPGDDPNPTITESCGDNGTRTDTPAANSFDCTFPDGPASSTVEVTADDGDPSNSTGSDSIVVAVANVAPTVELTGDASANEGQTKTYTYTVTDPGDDPNPTITESCGDNGTRTDTPAANSFDCTFPDGPASSTVEVTADDGDPSNSTGSDSIVVAVANVAPTVELTGDASANEGQTKTYTYTVTDPGDDPNPTITESCGDNGTRTDTPAANSFDCTFPDGPASSTVEVTADDGDPSNSTGSDSIVVAVANVAPTVELTGDASANEGQTKTYMFDTSDPGTADTFTLDATSCGASGSVVTGSVVFDPATGDGSFSCSFPDDNPTGTSSDPSTVSVTVSDDDGGTDSDSLVVTVNNVAPSVTITAPPAGNYPVGVPIPVSANFTDPGKLDTHTCTINGNPGNVTYTPPGSGTGTCTGTATPSSGGSFTITVVVRDDDNGVGTASSTSATALYAIYAHERCTGGTGKGIIVNGDNADIDGGIHSNGNFTLNGANFNSGTASLYRPQSGCSTVYTPSRVNFGPPSPTAPVNTPQQNWPWNPSRSEFTCTHPIKDDYIFNTANQTIPAGVYCARKTFKINASNITGTITVLAPEIVINGKNINLTPYSRGMLLFNVNPETGALSSKEIVVDSDFTADTTATLSGVIHNPGGGVKMNGQAVHLHRGFLQGLWVEVNLKGFRMTY